MVKFIVVDLNFQDWIPILQKNDKIKLITNKYINEYLTDEYKFLPISIENYKQFNNIKNNIFQNNIDNIHILNNKSRFAKFMLENFDDNIPSVYYYNYDNQIYTNNELIINSCNKYISKPNELNGGVGILIINKKIPKENHTIQKYIDHSIQYVGHFLVYNGIIIKKIFFFCNHEENEIKKGSIKNFSILEELSVNESIFDNIFYNLNYSGFACSDFIIKNNKIIIFEINPRPGGSLVHDKKYFNIFIDSLDKIIIN